jgi:hypothetical protein
LSPQHRNLWRPPGAVNELLNYLPEQHAAAITPK